MQFQQPFDASKVEPSSGFPPPPPLADYHVRIVEAEMKPVKDNPNGAGFLELVLEILDAGPYAGVKVKDRLNLYNPSQQTVEIAYRQLSAYCHVCNVQIIQDSRQLCNIPFIANIGPQANDPRYASVYVVKHADGRLPGKQAAAPAQAPTAAPPAQAAPWGPPAAAPQAQPAAAPPWGPPPSQPAPQAAPAAAPWGPPAQQQQPPQAQPPANPGWGPPAAQPPSGAPPWQPGAAPAAAAPPPWAQR